MAKRYGKEILPKVLEMKKEGYTHRTIGEELGYSKKQIDKLIEKYNANQRKAKTMPPKQGGRPKNKPITTQEEAMQRIKQLEMENELLRSFLQVVGRK